MGVWSGQITFLSWSVFHLKDFNPGRKKTIESSSSSSRSLDGNSSLLDEGDNIS